jgi:uncharacterized membrane protein
VSQVKVTSKKKKRGMWPVIGLILAVALGAISWVVAPTVYAFIRQRLPAFSTGTFSEQQITLFVGILVFVVLASLASLIVAIFAPRKKQHDTRDAALRKEKEAMLHAERERKARKREVEEKMRQQNMEIAKRNEAERKKRQEEQE